MIYDTLNNIENYKDLGRVYTALKFLRDTDLLSIADGRYELEGDDIFYMVQSYNTDPDKTACEAHKKYIDIQLILSGEEVIGTAPMESEKTLLEAKPEGDIWFYECAAQNMTLYPGCFMVLYPSDLHCPGAAVSESVPCRKVVVKVRV